MTPEQKQVVRTVKGILKTAFPAFHGSLKFDFDKNKSNSDQVHCGVSYTLEKQ